MIFCPPGSAASAVSPPGFTPSPSTLLNAIAIPSVASSAYIKANYTYRGQFAGNAVGSYDMTWDLKTCQRSRVYIKNRVGPLSEEVSLVFRGPMEIFNIAVYLGNSSPSLTSWKRVSWYKRGGAASNLVFMNNKNIDYTGTRGPQGFASSDGKAFASQPQPFSGSLAEATNPELVGGGPGIDTGVEVNIMTNKPCSSSDGYDCPGFHGDTWSYHGWGGPKKVFVTQVQMPWGMSPNLPALWILNAQVLWSGQYSGCNCRGWGAAGGCGELDVAEVIESNSRRDKVSTHYYFYDGTVVSPGGGDNFATRPVDGPTVYITVFDSCECSATGGVVKILEVASFDFDQDVLSDAQVQQWINA